MGVRFAAFVFLFGAAATDVVPGRPQLPEMPWLHGLRGTTAIDTPNADVTDRIDGGAVEADCGTGASHGLALVADITPTPGSEMVLASFTHGIAVLGREGQLLASAPGYDCEGSGDEITAVAAGFAGLDPMIALAVTRGGHREQTTELALFRLGARGQLDPVFTAEVEHHRGDTVRRGDVWLIPGGLLYRPPGGVPSIWTFDPVGGAYVHRGSFRDSDTPRHEQPMI